MLPMLLVLLLGIADFGRVFTAGITLEAAARNAAEAGAQEYVQLTRNNPGGDLTVADYSRLHALAIDVACGDAEVLQQNEVFSGGCNRAAVAVCVHDAAMADACGGEATAAPPACTGMTGWTPGIQGGGTGSLGSQSVGPIPHIEVRICYRFTTLVNLSSLALPFGWGLSLGDIWLQRDRQFAVSCYPTGGGTGCG